MKTDGKSLFKGRRDARGGGEDRTVLVIHQYALPRSESGGTRHVELFEKLVGWKAIFFCGGRNYSTQERIVSKDSRFILVPVPAFTGSTLSRLIGWFAFDVGTIAKALFCPASIVYASTPQITAPLVGLIVARARRIPFILEVRDLWPDSLVCAGGLPQASLGYLLLKALERFLYRSADWIVGVTPGWSEYFDEMGVSTLKVVFVENSSQPSSVSVSQSQKDDFRRGFGTFDQVAVYAGAHGVANGLDDLLSAARDHPGVAFLLVGHGPEKERLVARAQMESLENVFFWGAVPKERIFDILSLCDIGVHCLSSLPVLQKGMSPNKVFDYMGCGLVVVSNAGKGLVESLDRDDLAVVGDWGQMSKLIARVMDLGPEGRDAMGQAAKCYVNTKHSSKPAAARMQALLDAAAPGP